MFLRGVFYKLFPPSSMWTEESKPASTDALYIGPPSVKQVAKSRLDLEITPTMRIGVAVYIKTKKMDMPTLSKVSSDARVKIDRTYTSLTDEFTPVASTDRLKALRYGGEFVPARPEDLEAMKFRTEKCLKLLGFFPREVFPVFKAIGNCDCIAAETGNVHAAMALSSLLAVLVEQEKVALARFSYQANAAPKIMCLYPHVSDEFECFYAVPMPYSEDSRENTLLFPSLPKPTAELVALVDDFVQSRDVSGIMGPPDRIPNPTLDRFFQTAKARVALPIEKQNTVPVAPFSEPIIALLKPEEHAWKQLPEQIAPLSQHLTPVNIEETEESKKRKKYWRDIHEKELIASPGKNIDVKKIRIESTQETAFSNVEISATDPVGDFETAIRAIHSKTSGASVTAVVEKMTLVIAELATSSPVIACDAIVALRTACISEELPAMFNAFMKRLSDSTLSEFPKFWRELLRRNVMLITKDDCDKADIDFSKATEFIENVIRKI